MMSTWFFFKEDASSSLAAPLEHPVNYQILSNFDLLGFGYDIDPWTDQEAELLCRHLRERDPDVIGFSLMSCFDTLVEPLLERLRRACPRSLFVAGGHGPTYRPRHHATLFDAVIVGEGETSFPAFLEPWPDREAMFRAPNVAHVDAAGTFIQNPLCPLVDLADLPLPLYHGGDTVTIQQNRLVRGDVLAATDYQIMAGRGCPQNCTYCCNGQFKMLYRSVAESRHIRRNRPLDAVMEELRYAKSRGVKSISFLDEYLLGDTRFIIDLLTRYKEEIDLPFTAVLHPEQALNNPEILDAAVHAGMMHATIGVQSGSGRIFSEVYRRRTNKKSVIRYGALAREKGLQLTYHLIFGNPLETEDDMRETRDFMHSVPFSFDRDKIFCFQLTLFPGTPIESMVREQGRSLPPSDTWLRQSLLCQAAMAASETEYEAFMDRLQQLPTQRMKHEARQAFFGRLFMAGRPVTSGLAYEYYRSIAPLVPERVLVWGAGGAFVQHKDVLAGKDIVCAIDTDATKHDTRVAGVEVRGPEALADYPDLPVFIFSSYRKVIIEALHRLSPGRRAY